MSNTDPGLAPEDVAPTDHLEDHPPSGPELLGVAQSPYAHPQWALGMVLVLAVPFLVMGLFGHPIWLLLGSPFLLVLAIWIVVRVLPRVRPTAGRTPRRPGV
jgi:hypothetical protein